VRPAAWTRDTGEALKGVPPQQPCVLPAPLTALPSWLVSGLALGAAASVVIAVVFALGERYIPAPDRNDRGDRRVGGAERQRAEIRALFRAADEPFFEQYEIRGTTVDFYFPDHDVAVTFDPRAYLRLADGPTYVVLCEYEMPAATLGRRLPFDIGVDAGARAAGSGPYGSRAGPRARADPVGDAFDVLGLGRDADTDDVQSAYREQVKELHPDQGGSEEEFKRLQEAYTTAKEYAS